MRFTPPQVKYCQLEQLRLTQQLQDTHNSIEETMKILDVNLWHSQATDHQSTVIFLSVV